MTRADANESVALVFTRVMNATPSRLGVLSDFMGASVISAALVALGLFAIRHSRDPAALYAVVGLAGVPLVASLAVAFALRSSRRAVVEWLSSLPFPIDNMNALLAGLGDSLEIFFAEGALLPTRNTLQPKLDEVSDDVLLVAERADQRMLEIKLGIIDSKRVPFLSNHRRYLRLVAVTERVLAPLAESARIERVHVV